MVGSIFTKKLHFANIFPSFENVFPKKNFGKLNSENRFRKCMTLTIVNICFPIVILWKLYILKLFIQKYFQKLVKTKLKNKRKNIVKKMVKTNI